MNLFWIYIGGLLGYLVAIKIINYIERIRCEECSKKRRIVANMIGHPIDCKILLPENIEV